MDKSSAKKDLKSLVTLSHFWDITLRSMKHLRRALNIDILNGSKISAHWSNAGPNGLLSKGWKRCDDKQLGTFFELLYLRCKYIGSLYFVDNNINREAIITFFKG